MAALVTIIAAIIGCAGSIAAAVITTRRAGPAGTVPIAATANGGTVPWAAEQPRTSKSVWFGLAGLIMWILPVLAYFVVLPGLYIGIRDSRGPRTGTTLGITLCAASFLASLANSAWGAYLGAHGQLWFQHGSTG